jgi:hypothetical protein
MPDHDPHDCDRIQFILVGRREVFDRPGDDLVHDDLESVFLLIVLRNVECVIIRANPDGVSPPSSRA